MAEREPVIITGGLTRRFGDFTALDHLSLQVCRGQITRMVIRRILPEPARICDVEMMVRFRTSRTEDDLGNRPVRRISGGIHVTQFRDVPSDPEDVFLSVTGGDTSA